ncbi:MAG: hypothetical protein K8R88_01595 [Armatimonadetes bacterium]|nr:hypothetical protein [Armatimonadota bacterium]
MPKSTVSNQIRQASVNGAEPSDLLDRRDNLLEQLSGLVNVTTQDQADGTVNVFMSEATLVDGATSTDLPSGINAAGQLTDGTHTYTVRSGQLAGHLSNTTQIKTQLAQLDTLANTIRTQVNAIHTTGLNANGTTAINFFNDALPGDPQTGAIDFDLSVEVASDTKNIAIGVTAAAGDNGLALQISGLRSVSVASLGNKSMLDYHKDNVAAVGSNHAYFMNAADTQGAIAEQIDNQRQAVSGVSIDDEMSNMLKYQKSYQAAAKMVGVFDQMAQDIIGMIR